MPTVCFANERSCEEGVGAELTVTHHGPAVLGSEVIITATLELIDGNSVTCAYQAKVGERLIASGKVKQKIINRLGTNLTSEELDKLVEDYPYCSVLQFYLLHHAVIDRSLFPSCLCYGAFRASRCTTNYCSVLV